jgi:hypothetical protein
VYFVLLLTGYKNLLDSDEKPEKQLKRPKKEHIEFDRKDKHETIDLCDNRSIASVASPIIHEKSSRDTKDKSKDKDKKKSKPKSNKPLIEKEKHIRMLGVTNQNPNQLYCKIMNTKTEVVSWMPFQLMRRTYPQVLITFFEENITWN